MSCASPQDVHTHSSPPAVTVDDGSLLHLMDEHADIERLRDALAASHIKEAVIGQQLDDERLRGESLERSLLRLATHHQLLQDHT